MAARQESMAEVYRKWAKSMLESHNKWRDAMVRAVSHADAWYKYYVPRNSHIITIGTERERDRSRNIGEYIERIIELQTITRQTIDLRDMMRTVTETLDYDGEPKVIVVSHNLEPRTYKYSLQVRDRYVLRKITLRGSGAVNITIIDSEGGAVLERFPLHGNSTHEFNRVLGPHIIEITNQLGTAVSLAIEYYGPVPPGYDPVKQEEEEAYNPFEDDQVRIDGI